MTDKFEQVENGKGHATKEENSALHEEMHEHRKSNFKGLNLGIIKIGVQDHSLAFGVNVGIAKADALLGQETRVDAGVGAGPIGAKGGVGIGIDRKGLHGDIGAKARITDELKAGAGLGANLGPRSGAEAGLHAKVGDLFHTKQDASSVADKNGFNNNYDGNIDLFRKAAGIKTGAHANLNKDSSLGAGGSARIGDASLGAGADLDTNGNRMLRPDLYLDANKGAKENRVDVGAQLGPSLDARLDTGYRHVNNDKDSYRAGRLSAGVGENGIGVKATEDRNEKQSTRKFGIGRDYSSEQW